MLAISKAGGVVFYPQKQFNILKLPTDLFKLTLLQQNELNLLQKCSIYVCCYMFIGSRMLIKVALLRIYTLQLLHLHKRIKLPLLDRNIFFLATTFAGNQTDKHIDLSSRIFLRSGTF